VKWVAFNFTAFLGVTAALISAGDLRRLRYTLPFLLLSTISTIVSATIVRAQQRRAETLATMEIKWGERIAKPLWMAIGEYTPSLFVSALLGAVLSLLGFPLVGLGLVFAIFIFVALGTRSDSLAIDSDITFEQVGLRLHVGGGSFLISWRTIDRMETWGPDDYCTVVIHIMDRAGLIETAQPDSADLRRRVSFLMSGTGIPGSLQLGPWIAGLDATTLQRFVRVGMTQSHGANH
jgi:hypothetical protein